MAELFSLLLEWFVELLIYATGRIFYDRFIDPYDFRSILFWLAIILGAVGLLWWELR